MSTLLGGSSHDDVLVCIYPDTAAGFCGRHRARFVAASSATAVAVAAFCVVTSTLVWSGHIGRRTPAATDLVSHYAASDGLWTISVSPVCRSDGQLTFLVKLKQNFKFENFS